MAIQGIRNIILPTNPITGTKRGYKEVVETGIDRNNPSSDAKSALEAIHGITGEIVGTEKTQTLTNKTYLGNGAGLTDLNGSAVTTGTVVAGRLPALNAITAPAADVAMNSQKITGLAAPTEDDDAATMEYVDDKYSRTAYSHSFSNASSVPITHSLGYYPDVTILKEISSGVYDEVEAQVAHASTLALTVTLSGATEGLVLMR
jgi:hypothetical protein